MTVCQLGAASFQRPALNQSDRHGQVMSKPGGAMRGGRLWSNMEYSCSPKPSYHIPYPFYTFLYHHRKFSNGIRDCQTGRGVGSRHMSPDADLQCVSQEPWLELGWRHVSSHSDNPRHVRRFPGLSRGCPSIKELKVKFGLTNLSRHLHYRYYRLSV